MNRRMCLEAYRVQAYTASSHEVIARQHSNPRADAISQMASQ